MKKHLDEMEYFFNSKLFDGLHKLEYSHLRLCDTIGNYDEELVSIPRLKNLSWY